MHFHLDLSEEFNPIWMIGARFQLWPQTMMLFLHLVLNLDIIRIKILLLKEVLLDLTQHQTLSSATGGNLKAQLIHVNYTRMIATFNLEEAVEIKQRIPHWLLLEDQSSRNSTSQSRILKNNNSIRLLDSQNQFQGIISNHKRLHLFKKVSLKEC